MPRLKAAVQTRKETSLESLRDALRHSGRLIRPRLGCPGYGAVRVALRHWRPDFDEVGEKERLALLRAARRPRGDPFFAFRSPTLPSSAAGDPSRRRRGRRADRPPRGSSGPRAAAASSRAAADPRARTRGTRAAAPPPRLERQTVESEGSVAATLRVASWIFRGPPGPDVGSAKSYETQATQWDTERNSKKGPHERVDAAIKERLTAELIRWLEAPAAAADAAAAAQLALRCKRKRPHTEAPRASDPPPPRAPRAPRRSAKREKGSRQRGFDDADDFPEDAVCEFFVKPRKGPSPANGRGRGGHSATGARLGGLHAVLHPDCPHAEAIAIGGAVAVSHQRPGDARPHIDFMLPDGTLDCRFDSYCDALAGECDGGACCNAPNLLDVLEDQTASADAPVQSRGRCLSAGLIDASSPGAFAVAARSRPVRHGDHFHRLAGIETAGCGTLWPTSISEEDLDLLFAVDAPSPRL